MQRCFNETTCIDLVQTVPGSIARLSRRVRDVVSMRFVIGERQNCYGSLWTTLFFLTIGCLVIVKALVGVFAGCPAHQMHSCLSLILIICRMMNSTLHLAQESLCCSTRRGG